jgi:soluble lytic murein transglycosylase-like protein
MSGRVASILWRVALGTLAGLVPGVLQAGTFRHVDEAGVVHYTNVPPDARYQQIPEAVEPPKSAGPSPASPALARFADHIRTTAARYGVDHRLVEAVIVVESGGNPRAVSPKGATGLMQLMPQRAALLGVRNAFDPYQNLEGGIRHLRDLLERFDGNVALALAAYNAGEEAVRWYRGIPPYRETQHYVRRIRALYGAVELPIDSGAAVPRSGPAPVYETVQTDGSVLYTNLPPR